MSYCSSCSETEHNFTIETATIAITLRELQ
jgi:hypothetical protein